jgi:ribosomal protein S18 acetylase RimI-like enzyme
MALATGLALRQMTAADIPAVVALGDATWSALYGRTGYATAELLEVGLQRPGRDPERDDPAIFAGNRFVAGASLQAWPPMTEVICPIVVDLELSSGDRSACIDALIGALQKAARARLAEADAGVERVFGVNVPTRDTGLRDHVRGLGWTLLRTSFELAIDLTDGSFPDVEWPEGMSMRTFGDAAVVEPAIAVMTEAFADHHGDYSAPDQWRHWLTATSILPDASYLLNDADGPVGALASSSLGAGEGYVGAIGVRRRGRRKGATTAMLRRAFRDLAAAGYSTATLDVDGENTTGALGLYERAGMSVRVATEAWVTPLHRA